MKHVTHENGDQSWYLDYERTILHREDGPAVEYKNGDKYWYQHGKRHREDGPAVEFSNGQKFWYVNSKRINCSSQEEFEKLIKLKAFW